MWNGLTEFQVRMLEILDVPQPELPVTVHSGGKGLTLERTPEGWQMTLEKEFMLGRATALLEENADQPVGWRLQQCPAYDRLGVMLDCSRNAVPRPETVENLIRIICRMGCNTLQLYMEDVFELPGYPYFGYGRGRYTAAELQQLDRFAASLGIELVPAIQTLAHMGQALKWKAMADLVDCGDILLIDDPETEKLLRAIFARMRQCFSGNRINIGMDEAHMVGLGRYLDQHGYCDRTRLMLRHFEKVHAIAGEYGFAPMMWSDMFFRLATGGNYYAPDCAIDPQVSERIPDDTTLIYWDYYTTDASVYDRMLEKHRQMGKPLAFAAGAWKWSGFAPANQFSIQLARLAHRACRNHGVPEVLVTMWGDNGSECSPFAVLPVVQTWAELCWTDRDEGAAAMLQRTAQMDWNTCLLADGLAFTPDNPAPGRCGVAGAPNAAKTLLYEDPLFPLFGPGLDLSGYAEMLQRELPELEQAATKNVRWGYLFATYAALARFLQGKALLETELRCAWRDKDRSMLHELVACRLPVLQELLADFTVAFHAQWLQENRAAGLDVFDLRVGGQQQRLATTAQRLQSWLDGNIPTVEELDEDWLPFDESDWKNGHRDPPAPFWHRIATPGSLAEI